MMRSCSANAVAPYSSRQVTSGSRRPARFEQIAMTRRDTLAAVVAFRRSQRERDGLHEIENDGYSLKFRTSVRRFHQAYRTTPLPA
jgi:hypothetical protein